VTKSPRLINLPRKLRIKTERLKVSRLKSLATQVNTKSSRFWERTKTQ